LIDKISKNGEITETDSIHEAIVIDLVTCPRCNKNFEISTDTKIMKCPHCGISGLVKK
jgi:ribosomal protein L37AE/L43A